VTNGNLFGASTYKWLLARSTNETKYMILMLDVPESFNGVATVKLKRGSAVVREKNKGRLLHVGVRSFL
jgi:hypothetical protein